MALPRSILSRELLPASIAIFSTVAIVAFEGLAVTAALPELTADLGGVRLLPWVITGFLLASAVTTAMVGSFVDALGTATVFRWSTIGFALSSVGAAAAPTMPILVAARVLQGASGGAIVSVGLAATALVFPPHLIGRALAANSNVWAVLAFAGPALAAALLQIGSWRWIFLLMAPICAVALIAGRRALPGPVAPGRVRLDWPSALWLIVAVAAVLGAVSSLTLTSIGLAVVAAAAAFQFWRRVGQVTKPLLERGFLGNVPYRQLSIAASFALAATLGISSYLPVYVRGVRGGSVAAAAWSVLWLTVGWTVAANVAGRITDRVSARSVLYRGAMLGVVTVAMAWVAVAFKAPLAVVFAAYFLMGTSVGAITNAALQEVRAACSDSSAGQATSAHAFMRTIGMSLGAGLAGGVILAVVAAVTGDVGAVREALAGEGADLAGAAVSALGDGFAVAHGVSLALMVVALGAARGLMRLGSD